eukprot:2840283-Rhodomonas_salina.4
MRCPGTDAACRGAAHAAPFLLFLFFPLVNAAPHVIAAVYTVLDVTCALLMRSIAAEYMQVSKANCLRARPAMSGSEISHVGTSLRKQAS